MNATRETLAARLRTGPLSPREATQICRALLSAIEAAHARGVAHGAISPQTIVLDQGRTVLAADGVPQTTDPLATDLYAVAAVFYESVTGRPWRAETDPSTADWSGVPRQLQRVLRRALSPVPEKRWQDAAAFQRALWAPRPQHPVWPALVVILFAAAIIAMAAFCKPLGLCWERTDTPAPSGTR